MSYFLADRPLQAGLTFTFAGEEAQHLLGARRVRPGERFALQDPAGRRFAAEIVSAERRKAEVRVIEAVAVPALPDRHVVLLQGGVKEKAADLIVQKSTELGVAEVCFFPAARTTVALRALESGKALARWQRIAWEACKQSDRASPPQVRVLDEFDAALQRPECAGISLLLDAGAGPDFAPCLRDTGAGSGTVRLLVGPEGGFTAKERERAEAAGFLPARLGPTTLRAETAAVAACTLALYA